MCQLRKLGIDRPDGISGDISTRNVGGSGREPVPGRDPPGGTTTSYLNPDDSGGVCGIPGGTAASGCKVCVDGGAATEGGVARFPHKTGALANVAPGSSGTTEQISLLKLLDECSTRLNFASVPPSAPPVPDWSHPSLLVALQLSLCYC